jgi:hypothetical protein
MEKKDKSSSLWDNFEKSDLLKIMEDFAKNWLAHDGLWFQTIESKYGLEAAIQADIEAWRKFAPIEAKRIKKRFQIPDNGGIPALVKALGLRMYTCINQQQIIEETQNRVVFQMIDCRVQSARTRKGMALFPCQPVGIVEYESFAREIDPKIKTRVLRCPPDEFNGECHCAWEFTI